MRSLLRLVCCSLLLSLLCAADDTGIVGQFSIVWNSTAASLIVTHATTAHSVLTSKVPFVQASTTAWTVQNAGNWGSQASAGGLDEYDGVANFLQCPHSWCPAPSVTSAHTVDEAKQTATDEFMMSGTFPDVDGLAFTLTFSRGNSSQDLKFVLDIQDRMATRPRPYVMSSLRVEAEQEEAFWGFGEQFTYLNQRGKLLRLINQEQGIFRGLQPESFVLNKNVAGTAGDWWTTYIALPQYISSSNKSLFFENYEPFVFDLTPKDHIVAFGNSTTLVGHILAGNSPGELLTEYTRYSGRMDPLPDWIGQGAVVHAQGGSGKVTPVLDQVKEANVSLAALWIEDWCGQYVDSVTGSVQVAYNWVLDRTHYPNWDTIVDAANDAGARVMVYLNPFLIWTPTVWEGGNATRNLFDEAYTNGYFVGYHNGSYNNVYYSVLITRVGGMVDMSNPAAVQWYKEVIKQEVFTNARASGYMADFGEWLPYRQSPDATHSKDVVLHSGDDPLAFHNEYTDIWASVHKDAVHQWQSGPNTSEAINADPVTMVRTGYLKAPGNAQLFWLGDQTVLWDEHDGLQSALIGLLSGGMSGFAISHSDIGGYAGNGFAKLALLKLCRTKNLFLRWTEMNAFGSVFRTHLGNAPDTNVQMNSDPQTLSHFARFAKLFAFLAPYRKKLMAEAQSRGWPVVRPLFFHHAGDAATHSLQSQFLLGENVLVAPVLSSKIKYTRKFPVFGKVTGMYAEIEVYLPRGTWTRLWYEDTPYVSEGEKLAVKVVFGKPAVFYKAGWDFGVQLSSFVHDELDVYFPSLESETNTTWNNCA